MKLSVLLCVYGGDNPERFDRVFGSLESQTVPADETVVVCDGGLTPELERVIANHLRENVKVVRSEVNLGRGGARNLGLDNCSNELVAICDSDDISVKTRFEEQLKCFEADDELAVCGGWAQETDSEDGSVRVRAVPCDAAGIAKMFPKRCPFNNMTVMMRKGAVMSAGKYENVHSGEDYLLWASLLRDGKKMMNLPRVMCLVDADAGFYERRGGIDYFRREEYMLRRMKEMKTIGTFRYLLNVSQRFFVQVCLTPRMRRLFYRSVIRKNPARIEDS